MIASIKQPLVILISVTSSEQCVFLLFSLSVHIDLPSLFSFKNFSTRLFCNFGPDVASCYFGFPFVVITKLARLMCTVYYHAVQCKYDALVIASSCWRKVFARKKTSMCKRPPCKVNAATR